MNRPRTATCGVCGRRGQIVWQGRSYLFLTAHGYFVRAASGIWWAHVTPYDDDDHSFQPPRFPRTLSARGPAVRLVSVPTVRDGSDDEQRRQRMLDWQVRVAADLLKPWLGPLTPRDVGILRQVVVAEPRRFGIGWVS